MPDDQRSDRGGKKEPKRDVLRARALVRRILSDLPSSLALIFLRALRSQLGLCLVRTRCGSCRRRR